MNRDDDASRMQRAAERTFAENEARRQALEAEPVAPMPAELRERIRSTATPE